MGECINKRHEWKAKTISAAAMGKIPGSNTKPLCRVGGQAHNEPFGDNRRM